MKVTYSTEITASDVDSRILAGQIVPFGKPGNTSAGPVIFEQGAFLGLKADGLVLNLEHDRTRPIGKAIDLSVTPGGISGRFKVAQTQVGSDVLVEAMEGLRTGFSIEANVDQYDVRDGVMYVSAAEMTGVAVVTRPAFGANAQITDVAASEDETVDETPTEMESVVTENTAPAVETPAEAVVEAASAPAVQAAAPIYTAPRQAPLSASEYVVHSVKAAMGDRESAIVIEAADDTTANNTGLTLARGLNEFIVDTFAVRPTIDAIGTSALPDSGMSFTIPRLLQEPTVATSTEGGAPSETGMTSDYLTVNVVKKSGLNRVSFELLERSAPAFGDLLLREMQKAYAKNTDQYVIALLTSEGTQAGAQAGTWEGLQAFVATEGPAAYTATGGDFANRMVASAAWWSELLGAKDNSDRPIFNAIAPSNAAGAVGINSASGTVFGAEFYVDPHIATVGLIDESAFLIAPDAVRIWESPTTQLRVNVLTTGEVEIGLHGYIAAKVVKAGGVRRFNLT